VILWFDNDDPGEKNAQKAVKLLLLQNKVHILVVTCAFKDAGDINTDPNKLKIIENTLSSAELGATWLSRKVVERSKNDKDKLDAMEEAREIYRQIPDSYLKKEFIKKVARGLNIKMGYLAGDTIENKKIETRSMNNMATLFCHLKTLVDKTEDIAVVGQYINRFYAAQKGGRMPRDLKEALETMHAMVNRLEVGELREYILENYALTNKE
jgi:DNA primase